MDTRDTPERTRQSKIGQLRCVFFFYEDARGWIDHLGRESLGASVTWSKAAHDLPYVQGPLTLELFWSIMTVGQVNSAKGRWSLTYIMVVGMGLVGMVAKEANCVLAEDETWHVFISMLEDAEFYLLNASACHDYLSSADSNRQAWLAANLAEKECMGTGLNETPIWKSVDGFLLEKIAVANAYL